MESWEVARFRGAAKRLFRANLRSVAAAAISSPLMDTFGAIAIALLLLLGRDQIATVRFTRRHVLAFIARSSSSTIRSASSLCSTTASSRRWAPRRKSSSSWIAKTMSPRSQARSLCRHFPAAIVLEHVELLV